MPAPTPRLLRRIRADFAPEAAAAVEARLTALTDEAYGLQDPERVQAALVLWSAGDPERFERQMELLGIDWRDVLVMGEVAHGNWPAVLDERLGAA